VLAIGSTLGVWPAAEIPFSAAQQGRPLVIINKGATEMDRLASVLIEGSAGVVLPALVREILGND
jgi:NAD-dependent deacetylase